MSQHLLELPLPKSWGVRMFNMRGQANDGNIRRAIVYARSKTPELGRGMARVAFKVRYNNRSTVIKIALSTTFGMRQMKTEIRALFDTPAVAQSNLFVPGIDYDTTNPEPLWIHVEYARPLAPGEFYRQVGCRPDQFVAYVSNPTADEAKRIEQNNTQFDPRQPLVQGMLRLKSEVPQLNLMDLDTDVNWGWYQNRVVIIDAGIL